MGSPIDPCLYQCSSATSQLLVPLSRAFPGLTLKSIPHLKSVLGSASWRNPSQEQCPKLPALSTPCSGWQGSGFRKKWAFWLNKLWMRRREDRNSRQSLRARMEYECVEGPGGTRYTRCDSTCWLATERFQLIFYCSFCLELILFGGFHCEIGKMNRFP